MSLHFSLPNHLLVNARFQDFVLSVARDAGPRSRRSFLASSAMYRITQVTFEAVFVMLQQMPSESMMYPPYFGCAIGRGCLKSTLQPYVNTTFVTGSLTA